jgi:hypothetical protein
VKSKSAFFFSRASSILFVVTISKEEATDADKAKVANVPQKKIS